MGVLVHFICPAEAISLPTVRYFARVDRYIGKCAHIVSKSFFICLLHLFFMIYLHWFFIPFLLHFLFTKKRYLLDLLASQGKQVLLVGPASCGKSSILRSYLEKKKQYPSPFSLFPHLFDHCLLNVGKDPLLFIYYYYFFYSYYVDFKNHDKNSLSAIYKTTPPCSKLHVTANYSGTNREQIGEKREGHAGFWSEW
jgi:hypothetical protein